jgi:hypothetical protein
MKWTQAANRDYIAVTIAFFDGDCTNKILTQSENITNIEGKTPL